MMLRVIVGVCLVALGVCTAVVIAVVLHAGKYDRQVEELQAEQEQLQDPEPVILDAVYFEDRKHCGLLEEEDP